MIKLDNIIPIPLTEIGVSEKSQIWGKNLSFEKGKIYLILAPSGKGKSTLLHCIYGLRKDFEGNIFFNEKNISQLGNNDWAEFRQNKCSIVFQDLRLFNMLTAKENILLKSNLTDNQKPYKSENEIIKMATRLGVNTLLEKPCHTLSFGQKQRIAIIRSLCQPFDYLLLDEPFSHLDEENIKTATELIKEECKLQKSSLILVSLGDRYYFDYDETIIL